MTTGQAECVEALEMKIKSDPIIGTCEFTDGPRKVREDSRGQYVLDYLDMKVYGVWILRSEDVDSTPCTVDGDEA